MLHYRKSSFSSLELHTSYDWQVLAPNTHHGVSDRPFCECFKCNSKITGCLQLYYVPHDSLLPTMLCFTFKAAKQLQPTSYGLVQTSLSSQVWIATKPRVPKTVFCIKRLLCYQGCIFYKYKLKYDLRVAICLSGGTLAVICIPKNGNPVQFMCLKRAWLGLSFVSRDWHCDLTRLFRYMAVCVTFHSFPAALVLACMDQLRTLPC